MTGKSTSNTDLIFSNACTNNILHSNTYDNVNLICVLVLLENSVIIYVHMTHTFYNISNNITKLTSEPDNYLELPYGNVSNTDITH